MYNYTYFKGAVKIYKDLEHISNIKNVRNINK